VSAPQGVWRNRRREGLRPIADEAISKAWYIKLKRQTRGFDPDVDSAYPDHPSVGRAIKRPDGLHVHMGHGLNYCNVQAVAAIPGVEELNIGHSIVARAVLVGMERAVRDMKEAIRRGQRV